MSVHSQAAALLVIVALGCGPHDPQDPSAETPSPIIVASPAILNLAEAETSWNADYLSGFHPREANQAEIWRWTLDEAAMRFRNPRADALLHLTVQGQTHVFDAPQTVAVRMGNLTVDSFVASGAITTRTVALGRELMGGSDSFIVEILVDKTFVPASVPGSASLDTRELGIRVVSAAIEPSVLVRPPRGLLATREIDGTGRSYRWTLRRVLLFGMPDARVFEVELRRAAGRRQTVRVAINGRTVDELVLEEDRWLRREYEAPPSPDGTSRAELLIEPGWRADNASLPRGLMIGDYLWRD